MTFTDAEKNYYEVLDIEMDETFDGIRSAYQRAKSAYKKDSVALYSIMSEEESLDLMRQIEIAYRILSDPSRRAEYDRKIGGKKIEPMNPFTINASSEVDEDDENAKIISIDRVPPMEDMSNDDNILVAPSTDFTGDHRRAKDAPAAYSKFEPSTPERESVDYLPSVGNKTTAAHSEPLPVPRHSTSSEPTRVGAFKSFAAGAEEIAERNAVHTVNSMGRSLGGIVRESIASEARSALDEIETETEWKGAFIRKVREARGIPLEELSEYSKIGKSYLIAIEEDNYSKLPATVYLRGFLIQIAKYLRLKPDAVSKAYLVRYTEWQNADRDRLRA